jgi:endo-1,4-beta-xylanase
MGEFVIWGLTDAHSWLDELQGKTEALLYDKQYKPKPAYDSIMVSLKAHPAEDVVSPYGGIEIDDPIDSTGTDSTGVGDSTIAVRTDAGLGGSLSMHVAGRTLFIAGAKSASVDVFDMQGRPVFSGKCEKGSIELKGISEGLYAIRVRTGSASLIKRIAIK